MPMSYQATRYLKIRINEWDDDSQALNLIEHDVLTINHNGIDAEPQWIIDLVNAGDLEFIGPYELPCPWV